MNVSLRIQKKDSDELSKNSYHDINVHNLIPHSLSIGRNCSILSDIMMQNAPIELSHKLCLHLNHFLSIYNEIEYRKKSLDRADVINNNFLQLMYNCLWFPYIGYVADIQLFLDIELIIKSSINKTEKPSKRCMKRIDKAILSCYTKKEILSLIKVWKNSDLNSYLKKALSQSIDAYFRKEYALVISFLVTTWEGLLKSNVIPIIKNKKIDLSNLETNTTSEEIFIKFYNNMVISACYCENDVIVDIPNRHAVAHSWFTKYPSKKTALNAILLTDFIIHLVSQKQFLKSKIE